MRDAGRLWQWFVAGELMLSFGPHAWRTIKRTRLELAGADVYAGTPTLAAVPVAGEVSGDRREAWGGLS